MHRAALAVLACSCGRVHFDPLGAGSDAIDGATAARFCDGLEPPAGFQTLFCRDFDDGVDPLVGWDQSNVTAAGSVQGDAIEFATSPLSLRTRLEDNPPSCSYARVEVRLPQTLTRAIVLLDVRLGSSDTDLAAWNSYVNIAVPLIAGNTCQLLFAAQGSNAILHEQIAGGNDAFYPMTIWPADQIWTRFRAELVWADRGIDVSFDGVSAFSNRLILRPECIDASSATVLVWFGQHCESGGGPREARFDNLAVLGL